jgi:hypothetical protein
MISAAEIAAMREQSRRTLVHTFAWAAKVPEATGTREDVPSEAAAVDLDAFIWADTPDAIWADMGVIVTKDPHRMLVAWEAITNDAGELLMKKGDKGVYDGRTFVVAHPPRKQTGNGFMNMAIVILEEL